MPNPSGHTDPPDQHHPDDPRYLPHERDEIPDTDAPQTHGVMEQAASDIARGLVDTDRSGGGGVEESLRPRPPAQPADPLPQRGEGMRERGN
ncbi:hypothetical protein [Massilia sp. TS11]|uniref:hypothetical protein n=1 Tax=Massilia sp. TS11 TaxID=2908003 RepID=UPI001EDB657B|nr:hypothetical protein [Massilia sp. TS11]MCG2586335.1 hypothetical protein [Massilia sp. TS11]